MTDTDLSAVEQDACFEAVAAQCAERDILVTRVGSPDERYLTLQLQGPSRDWTLKVDCGETSLSLPNLWLVNSYGLLAHVSYGGSVCVNDGQGLSIDADRHADLVAHTVLAGYDLLERSADDAAAGGSEFLNELEGYWLLLPSSQQARAALEVDCMSRMIAAYENAANKPSKRYFGEWGKPPHPDFRADKLSARRAIYVHRETLPPPPLRPAVLGPEFVEAVRNGAGESEAALWKQLLGPSMNGPKRLTLLVSVPRAAGGHSLVGVEFSARRGAIDREVPVTPITVRRHTPNYMRERGGASLALLPRHIAVVGCGSIGSEIADCLAASGVGKLTLIDPELYSEDNVFRHVLKPLWVDLPKVSGLQVELESRYPGLHVTEVAGSAQHWVKAAALNDFDAIIFALGMPTLERQVSRALRSASRPIPTIYTWLEPLDLGGHAVLTSSCGEGCLDCLYRDDEGAAVLYPRTSFLAPGQHVSRNLTGCASTFVPYGAIQARRTALMATELALDSLTSGAGFAYRYWVGPGTVAAEQGLRTTAWWKTAGSTTQEDATIAVFGRPCAHCRGSA